jgi:type VI secretion system secreted protein VgrG
VLVSFIEGDPDRPLISAFLGEPASAAVADESSSGETLGQSVVDPVLLSAMQEAEPLVLLCLLPEGGPFSPCAQPLCTCRMLMGRGAGVAR